MIGNLLIAGGGFVGIWLAFQWGSAALIKYKRDNDLN